MEIATLTTFVEILNYIYCMIQSNINMDSNDIKRYSYSGLVGLLRVPIQIKKLLKNKILIIFTIIILILSIFTITISQLYGINKPSIRAVIDVETDIVRVGEVLNFLGDESIGIIKLYHWDFDDGNSSNEKNPSHIYSVSGWFNVTLMAKGQDSESDSTSILVGVQRPDESKSNSRGFARAWRRDIGAIIDAGIDIGPNIGNPTCEININVMSLFGIGRIEIGINIDDPIQGVIWISLFEEQYNNVGDNIDLNYQIQSSDIPIEVIKNQAIILTYFQLEEGRDGGGSVDMSVTYPIDVQ